MLLSFALLAGVVSPAVARDVEPPLWQRIDAAIQAAHDGPWAEPSGDGEFLRRVYLDLTGNVPSVDAARRFLDDTAADKRALLIDQLLDSPAYARHMQQVFDVMWIERRADKHVPSDQWREYLRDAFAENKPYHQLVSEILAADGVEPTTRAPAKFYLDRDCEPNLVTRDISRMFFGMDLQCAQCHDHPLISDYLQRDYYGLFAFVSRSYVFEDKKAKQSVVAEKAEGDVTYKSVFDPDAGGSALPHLPGGEPIEEPQFEKDQAYEVAPADGVRPVPKYSRRAQLAQRVLAGGDDAFNKNIVNRMWAQMMGRGLVEPLGEHHAENPASHPELLERLGQQFAASGYDLKSLLRQLALSQTYQRSSRLADEMDPQQVPPETFAVAAPRPLMPEQLAMATMQVTGLLDNQRAALEAEQRKVIEEQVIEGKFSDGDAGLAGLSQIDAQVASLMEASLYDKLKGNFGPFINLFAPLAGAPQDELENTVHQALFLSNGSTLLGWLAPSGNNLLARLNKLEDTHAIAQELYLNVLSRYPHEEETADVRQYLESQPLEKRSEAISEIAWELITSAEFRFNH
jgi:hypothetical protein